MLAMAVTLMAVSDLSIAAAVSESTLYIAIRTTNVPEEPHVAPIDSYNFSVNMVKKEDVSYVRSFGFAMNNS